MKPTDFNYANLLPLDVLCTAVDNPVGRAIRFATAKLKYRNGWAERKRLEIANHCAIVVQLGDRLWLAEMVDDGLKINSMRKYLNNPHEVIVAVKRHRKLSLPYDRGRSNDYLVDLCQQMRDYDYSGVFQFLGFGKNSSRKFYCSELVEHIANRYAYTWDAWQLNRPGRSAKIAPVEIQLGDPRWSETVTDIYV